MDLGTFDAPSNFDISVLCSALNHFIDTPQMNGIPKWKKNQLNDQAKVAKEKLENREIDFYAKDIQAMLAASMLMLDKLNDNENADKETSRLINACVRNINWCKEIFDDMPI